MEKFLVISNHTAEDCERALQYIHQYHEGYLKHFLWGCKDGDHNGYAIIDAESHEHAKMSVPPLAREKTKIIYLADFAELIHKKAEQATG